MRMPARSAPGPDQSLRHATLEALRYVRGDRITAAMIGMMAIIGIFGLAHHVLMPVFARDVLHTGAGGLGLLMAANGVGALLGALTLASLGAHPHMRRLFFGGLVGFSAMGIAFAWSRTFWLSAGLLVGVGYCMIIAFATANTAIQTRAPDRLRGRVMGIYVLGFIGLNPFGALLAGAIARAHGAPVAVTLGGTICLVATLVAFRLVPLR